MMTNFAIQAKLPEDGRNATTFAMYVTADTFAKAAQRAQSYCNRAKFDLISLTVLNGDIPVSRLDITRK